MSHIVFECQGCDISQAPSGCGKSRACNRSWTYDRQARSRSMQSKCGAGRFFQASSPGKSSSSGGGSTRISTRKTIIRCSQPRLFRVRSSGFGARLRAPSPRRFTMSCTAVFRFAQRLCHATSSSFEISSGRGPRTTRPGGSGWGCGWARGLTQCLLVREPQDLEQLLHGPLIAPFLL